MSERKLVNWVKNNNKEYLIDQWDTKKNLKELGLMIEDVTCGSAKEPYWKCTQGHSWKAQIYNRTSKNATADCPVCKKNYNSITSWSKRNNKEFLIDEWDTERNLKELGLRIEDVTYGSGIIVYWKCSEGHSWKTEVYTRARKEAISDCPICRKIYNSIPSWSKRNNKEYLIYQWDTEKNLKEIGLSIDDATCGMDRYAYWKCEKGHSWTSKIKVRANNKAGSGCPLCNSLPKWAITNNKKHLIRQWDHEKNLIKVGLKIEDFTFGSDRIVYWRCPMGHSWKEEICSRTKENASSNCPICNNVLNWAKSNRKEYIINEWDTEKNLNILNINIEDVSYGSSKRVYWICSKNHNHRWEAIISDRTKTNGTDCPRCNTSGTSYPEQFIYFALSDKFQKVINGSKIWGYEYDIFIKDLDLLIEYDGHYFHRVLSDKSEIETKKENKAKEEGYNFLRIVEIPKLKKAYLEENVVYINPLGYRDLDVAYELLIKYINRNCSLNITNDIPDSAYEEASKRMRAA